MARVAFRTFGVLREQPGHPQVQGFIDRLDATFAAARGAPGFIWETGMADHYVSPRFSRPEMHAAEAATLSLWTELAAVHRFAYHEPHAETLRLRGEWFLKPEWPTYVTWWVEDAHLPTWAEAMQRLDHLHDHGPTPHAFTFKAPFDAAGQPQPLRSAALRGAGGGGR